MADSTIHRRSSPANSMLQSRGGVTAGAAAASEVLVMSDAIMGPYERESNILP